MGRPKKPTALKLIQGTLQKCRTNPHEPTPSNERPVPPEWLPEHALDHFNILTGRMDECGYASATYTEIIALTALNWTMILDPEWRIANEARQKYHRGLTSLGLTPESSSKVIAKKKEPEKASKWAI